MDTWDVLVIGGAAVGCAVARDAAGRGLRVLLAEAQDLGGDFAGQFALSGMRGLRPMAGREVDRLHRNCPHLTTLAGAPKARYLLRYLRRKPRPVPPINPLRFALLCAVDAAERGATIRMNAPVTDISEDEGFWRADVGGDSVRASLIVDTCGAFEREMGTEVDLHVALVSTGKRPEDCIFSMAYSKEYDVVGTRDAPAEAAYISEKISVPADTMAGYTLDTSKAPLVKVDPTSAADARLLAENVVAEMAPFMNMIGKKWTRTAVLPGGDFHAPFAQQMLDEIQNAHRDADSNLVRRLFATYGTEATQILQTQDSESGIPLSEVKYLKRQEWARTVDQVIWRRTGVGSGATADDVARIEGELLA